MIKNPELEAFQAVVKTSSIHAAAAELGLTQTAVTKRIQNLENEMSLTLFIRSRRGMRLTEDGSALLQYCRAMNELEGSFLSQVLGKNRRENSITIVGPTSTISTQIVESCCHLYKKFPHLRLHLKSDDNDNGIELVRRGEADFAITYNEAIPNEMSGKILKPNRFCLLACGEWKGRKLQDILENERIIDFSENDAATLNYLKKFNLLSLVKKSRLFVNENEALIHLFCNGVGFGVLTEPVARPHLESGKLTLLNKGQVMEEPIALVWYPRSQTPDYFAEIIRSIK
ncbi:MAG: LysR family transcriptional regulator [Pseudobdellovibrionaceae bacterium]